MKIPRNSLRRQLTHLVLWPALLLITASGVFDYLNTRDMAQSAQDSKLQDTAMILSILLMPDEDDAGPNASQHVRLDPEDVALFRSGEIDDIRFLVKDAQSTTLAGDAQLQPLMSPDQDTTMPPRFTSITLDGQSMRAVELRHSTKDFSNRVLLVSTTRQRDADARRMFIRALLPNLLLLGFTLGAILAGVTWSTRSLGQLAQTIDQRPDNDLTPIAQKHLPSEVKPLTGAINRLLARQRRASEQQQLFLSSAAHQLRTPLAGVQAQLELADTGDPAGFPARLARVRAAVAQLSHCTHQMLALARSSEDASSMQNFASVNLPELLEETASHWLDVALARRQTLEFDTLPAACIGSRWMLLELLNNLIDNAIKYSPEGARIGVRCGPLTGGGAFLEVEDEGAGIAVAERAAVRQPIYRGESTAAGSGLGLTIVSKGAARHGASLQLLDGRHGHGLRARIEFVSSAAGTRR
jgi:two-component system sensor histidine kinase TctE